MSFVRFTLQGLSVKLDETRAVTFLLQETNSKLDQPTGEEKLAAAKNLVEEKQSNDVNNKGN